MTDHKFKAGQSVELRPKMGSWSRADTFSIVRTMPPEGRENQYRLKSKRDGHERVAAERDISLLPV